MTWCLVIDEVYWDHFLTSDYAMQTADGSAACQLFLSSNTQASRSFKNPLFLQPVPSLKHTFFYLFVSAGMRAAPSAAVLVTATAMAPKTSVPKSSTSARRSTPSRAHRWDPDATLLLWWAKKKKKTQCPRARDNFMASCLALFF